MKRMDAKAPGTYSPAEGSPLRSDVLSKLKDKSIKSIIPDSQVVDRAFNHLFGFEPLVSVSPEDEKVLEGHMRKRLSQRYSLYIGLTNALLSGRIKIVEDFKRDVIRPATRKEIAVMLAGGSKSNWWLQERRSEFFSSYFGSHDVFQCYGSRGLKGYPMDIRAHVNELYEKNKRSVRVLDVGSCDAYMLYQLKKEFGKRVETHGLSPFEEAHFKIDYYHKLAAERLPAEFKEYFDLIVSNRTLEYVLLPHHALDNIVRSIAPGGRADLEWNDHRLPIMESPELSSCLDGYLRCGSLDDTYELLKRGEAENRHTEYQEATGVLEKISELMTKDPIYMRTVLAWCKEIADLMNAEGIETKITGWGKNFVWVPARLLIERKD